MAKGWQRDKAGRVVFYYYEDGAQRKAPRSDTKWLDREPDHNVDAARERWGYKHLRARKPTEVLTHAETLQLVEDFGGYYLSRKKDPRTVKNYKSLLVNYSLVFFVQKQGLEDPRDWPRKSVRLLDYLRTTGIADRTINRINVATNCFWRWLVEEGKVEGPLLLRNAIIGQQLTPLAFTATPEQILAHVYPNPTMRLMALVGYFFSLRPQELVALRVSDFRAGTAALGTEAAKVMGTAGFFDRLVVNVHRQRVESAFKVPKVNSKGWVACFSKVAALEIVGALKEKSDPQALLFGFGLTWWTRLWKKNGYPGLTLKDLRRASIYWLGNYTELPFNALKNHARHADPSTTALYTRRPGSEEIEFEALDLDA